MTSINVAAIKTWYTGKALEKATAALELLLKSEEQGFWVKGASRSVPAALGKSGRGKKVAKTLNYSWEQLHNKPLSVSYYALNYGDILRYSHLTLQEALQGLPDEALMHYFDFQPVAALMAKLNATKAPPVFTTMNASPTVSAELKRQDAVNVEVCPMRWEERTKEVNGKTVFYTVGILLWPKGTRHGTSRYGHDGQCHACGHAIRNSFNWVPLILTTATGDKKSLWVGRDCAKTLFGVDMAGDLELAEGQR
jgi:hypothetical protein